MPKLDSITYVDTAEQVIIKLKDLGKGKISLTTSKIRNLLAMVSELQTDAKYIMNDKLTSDMQSRIQYLKMRIAYEAGREKTVKEFVENAKLLEHISNIKDSKAELVLFCNYMEALVAYHRYYGGRD